jgi:hypothetical protein
MWSSKVPVEILCSEFLKITSLPDDQHQAILTKFRRVDSMSIYDLLSDLFEIQHLLTDGEYKFFTEGLCARQDRRYIWTGHGGKQFEMIPHEYSAGERRIQYYTTKLLPPTVGL